MKRGSVRERYLSASSSRRKGLSDVSENHDRYLVEGEFAAMKKSAMVQKTTAAARSQ
jgi:hypothetical protein